LVASTYTNAKSIETINKTRTPMLALILTKASHITTAIVDTLNFASAAIVDTLNFAFGFDQRFTLNFDQRFTLNSKPTTQLSQRFTLNCNCQHAKHLLNTNNTNK